MPLKDNITFICVKLSIMLKKLLYFFFLCLFFEGISQIDRKKLQGKIHDDLGSLPNIHVINTTTKMATYTDEDGAFSIFAIQNDTLKITAIGYKTLIIKVENKHLGIATNIFKMTKDVIELDEVEVKKHYLTGSLTSDVKNTPKDYRKENLKKTMDFSKIDMTLKSKDDHIDRHVRPPIVQTDPLQLKNMLPIISSHIPFKHSEKLWVSRKDISFKKAFPNKLFAHYGKDFFYQKLKIPPKKYTLFIQYCSFSGIEELFKKKKHLEVIKVLRKESVEYLKTLKKQ